MGSRERRQRVKQDTRGRILDAARELFVTHGYEHVSMRRIAQAIEYTPTAIYRHFADKEALFRELCLHDFAAFNARLLRVANGADPVQRIAVIGRAYIRFGLEHPQHYRHMFMEVHPSVAAPEEAPGQGDPTRDGYALLVQTVAQAIAQKRLLAGLDDPHLVAQALWASVHGMVALHIAQVGHAPIPWAARERRVELAVAGVMRGLLRRPEELPLTWPRRREGRR